MRKHSFRGLGFLTAVCLLLAAPVLAQEDLYSKRKQFMEASYDDLKAIKKAVDQKDYSTVELKARNIMGSMDKLVDYFPKGVQSEKSRAKPEIWQKWDEFSKLPVKVKDAAGALAKAAAAKDDAAVQAQLKALGQESPFRSGACFECHKEFRSSPPRKSSEG
jgi:cytochrome c556